MDPDDERAALIDAPPSVAATLVRFVAWVAFVCLLVGLSAFIIVSIIHCALHGCRNTGAV
jgi:hypothetical protein